MIRPICLFLTVLACVGAEPIPISKSMFTSPDFVKSFTGSYGILSPVEPKVTRAENEILLEISELFGEGQFRTAEKKLITFMQEQKAAAVDGADGEVSPALIFVLGNLYFQNGQTEDAIRAYKLAIKKFPKFRRAFKNLSLLYASNDDYKNALPYLKEAVQLGDADHRTYGLLGFCYLSKEKPLAAEGAYRQAFLLNPDERDWKLGLAQALLAQEKWTESAALLNELINESPDNAELWMQQANCYLGKGDTKSAATNFEVLRLKGLADSKTLSLLGNIYMDNEQPGLALNAYLEALNKQEKPDINQALDTAKILVDFDAHDQAKTYLEKISSYNLQSGLKVRELLIRKSLAEAEGDTATVEKLLMSAQKEQPGNGEVIIALGRFYMEQAKNASDEKVSEELLRKAEIQFNLGLSKDSVKYEANLRYGQLKVSKNEYSEALTYLNTALQLNPSDNLKQYIRRVERAAKRDADKS